jgi:hypothetical protein
MPQNQKAFKLIAVKNREYDRLRQLGHTPDSFNTVIGRLIDFYERNNNVGGAKTAKALVQETLSTN